MAAARALRLHILLCRRYLQWLQGATGASDLIELDAGFWPVSARRSTVRTNNLQVALDGWMLRRMRPVLAIVCAMANIAFQ